jgi:hypothetical protein
MVDIVVMLPLVIWENCNNPGYRSNNFIGRPIFKKGMVTAIVENDEYSYQKSCRYY